MNELPTLGQLWANNVVDSLNSQQPNNTPNTDTITNIANQKIQKRTAKKQALADSLTIAPNTQIGGM